MRKEKMSEGEPKKIDEPDHPPEIGPEAELKLL